MMTGANIVHIPYRGGAPALTDLIGGQVQVYFGSISEAIEYIKAGKVHPLAVTNGVPPMSVKRAAILGSVSAALTAGAFISVGCHL
jgi:hypothetical protein